MSVVPSGDEDTSTVVYDDDSLDGDDGSLHRHAAGDESVVVNSLQGVPIWRVGWMNWTQSLVNMLNMVGWADGQLLPATFRAMEIDLGFTPASLGSLALVQSLVSDGHPIRVRVRVRVRVRLGE